MLGISNMVVLSYRGGSAVFRRSLAPAPALKILRSMITLALSFNFIPFFRHGNFFLHLKRTLADVAAALRFSNFEL